MFEHLLVKLTKVLEKAGIPFMVIGGQAVLVYGEPRLTRDIDLTLALGPDELPKLMATLSDLGLRVLVPNPTEFVAETLVLPCQDPETEIRVDFIFSLSDYESESIRRVHRVRVRSAEVPFASVEDIIIQKIVAGRPRDMEDAQIILSKTASYDTKYVDKWLAEFETLLGRPLRNVFRDLSKPIDPPGTS